MTVPTSAVFARRFRALSAAERATFVADLATARGWTTKREGCVVVAERDGTTRRIAVAATSTEEPVDEIVVPTGAAERRARPVARGTDSVLVGPDDLRARLLYGIDRGTATAIYEAHFGVALETDGRTRTDPTAGQDGDDHRPVRGVTSWRVPTIAREPRTSGPLFRIRFPRRRVRRTALVGGAGVVLLVIALTVALGSPLLAGASGPTDWVGTGTDDTDVEQTATGAVGSDGEANLETANDVRRGPPPGLSAEGITDLDRLADAHVANARRHPTSRLEITYEGPRFLTGFDTRRSGFDPDDSVRVMLQVRTDHAYRFVQRTNFSGPPFMSRTGTFETYTNGEDGFHRRVADGETSYVRVPPSDLNDGYDLLEDRSRDVLGRYLDTNESHVEQLLIQATVRYRVTAVGDPVALDHDVTDYRAVALVTPGGTVTNLWVTYDHPGTSTTVRVHLAYYSGDEDLTVPKWLAAARNETR